MSEQRTSPVHPHDLCCGIGKEAEASLPSNRELCLTGYPQRERVAAGVCTPLPATEEGFVRGLAGGGEGALESSRAAEPLFPEDRSPQSNAATSRDAPGCPPVGTRNCNPREYSLLPGGRAEAPWGECQEVSEQVDRCVSSICLAPGAWQMGCGDQASESLDSFQTVWFSRL